MQKAYNVTNGHGRMESEDRPASGAFDNLTSTSIHLGTRSEITDFSTDGMTAAQSEITEMSAATYTSENPLRPSLRFSRLEYIRSSRYSTRRTTFLSSTGFSRPVGDFSRNVKDRARFVWELFKLNYRMLISLTLTIFVAIFVSRFKCLST